MAEFIKVKFEQAAHVGGKDYGKGTHELPKSVLKDGYFNKLLKAGHVKADGSAPSAETDQQRQDKINKKLIAQSDATIKKVAEAQTPVEGDEPGVEDEESEDFFDGDEFADEADADEEIAEEEGDDEPSPKKKKKAKKKKSKSSR